MKKYLRTDLACEATNDLRHIDGTEYSTSSGKLYTVERLKIITKEAEDRLGKCIGTYVTLSTSMIWLLDDSEIEELSEVLSRELLSLMLRSCGVKALTGDFSVLVVGLGNSSITPDAIGPQSVEGITATRHIKSYDADIFDQMGFCEISTLTPGVLGKTGIESAETVKATVESVRPDAVIIIDALAAGSVERLARTVQLSDTGINPGAGIGNLRSGLTKKTLGVPVISIGVPTVVDSSAMVCEALIKSGLGEIPEPIAEYLEKGVGYYVTPKETDLITEKVARLLSRAISSALVI